VNLSVDVEPAKRQRGQTGRIDRSRFGRGVIGIEDETSLVGATQENVSSSRLAISIDRRDDHGIWLRVARRLCVSEPHLELIDRIVEQRIDVQSLRLVTDPVVGQIHFVSFLHRIWSHLGGCGDVYTFGSSLA